MKNSLSPKERVEAVLKDQPIDKTPFTVYGTFWGGASIENPVMPFGRYFPQCTIERQLRNRGLCIVDLTYWGYTTKRQSTKIVSTVYEENERFMVRTDYKTPFGDLNTIKEVSNYTVWNHKKMFENKEDYKKILFLLNDLEILPDNETGLKMLKTLGEDVILRGDFGFEPLQELISGDYFTTEEFCIQWMDNRDEILKLYDAIVRTRRDTYEIVAQSPVDFICYGGNVTPQIISPENFKKYYIPHYEEAAEVMHKKGKFLACHFDANMRILKDMIAETPLDIIEAFTPFPDTDMTLKEAKLAWPNKVLWINFPSSLHLASEETIFEATGKIIDESKSEKLILGITEDVPEDKWQRNYQVIMDAIDKKSGIR
ncbi:MAG: hypothetical protein M1365_02405 [Actinobacteria bacterium]|nr:hypothetical protein [Actinomycetota bacterium]